MSENWKPVEVVKYPGGEHSTGFDCICGVENFWIYDEEETQTCDECGRVYRLVCRLEVDESKMEEALV